MSVAKEFLTDRWYGKVLAEIHWMASDNFVQYLMRCSSLRKVVGCTKLV
jgi:hypothetical protein